jgi:alkylhydroperoxidase family enzyme
MAIRESIEAHSTFDPGLRSAIALAAGAAAGGSYSASINRRIALRSGWSAEEVEALRTGKVDDPKLLALLTLVQAAAANFGGVPDGAWDGAVRSGWTARELVDAFAIVALTQFVDGFATFAQVEVDGGRPA